MRLSELKQGDKAIITKILGRGAFRKRLIEMGFVKGKEITVTKYAPLRDPVEYSIMDYEISLRKSEANLVEVVSYPKTNDEFLLQSNGTFVAEEEFRKKIIEKKNEINIALVGNPNCGKTTLFNYASGSDEHVGNYGGVTVDSKIGYYKLNDYKFVITDLPGTYSISAYSPEELFVRRTIIENTPDLVVNVIDAANLERNLYLTAQLIDMDIKVVIALNLYDELLKKEAKLDIEMLSTLLGIPIVPTVAATGQGIKELFECAISVFEDKSEHQRHIHINYGKEIEKSIKSIQKLIKNKENLWLTDLYSTRFLAIKLLEEDEEAKITIKKCNNSEKIFAESKELSNNLSLNLKQDCETLISDARYGFIAGALKETYVEGKVDRYKTTKHIDTLVTHKFWGFPIFIVFLYLMFVSTFKIGEYPMMFIEWSVEKIAQLFDYLLSDGILKDLLVDGIINGVGSVIVFLPNILILFFFISLMEDTGYMARVAFIMDKLMHKIGLHGRSFIPLLMGFGCNVPAIMATRTIENRGDRILTMLINPFMSCSARLPIYLLVAGVVFPKNAGTVLFAIYATGILVAILMALLFKKTIFKTKEAPFVMELPPYRMPTTKVIIKHMWHKGRAYLKKMGGVILIASIIIWALGYFPKSKNLDAKYNKQIEDTTKYYDTLLAQDSVDKQQIMIYCYEAVNKIRFRQKSEHQKNSFIGKIGIFFEPIMRPLGFDWKMTVGVITGVSAKEIVVSTLGVLYQKKKKKNLTQRLQSATYETGHKIGQKIYTPAVALAFMVFVLIYFPCIATIAAVKKETGSWKWALFMVFYTTGLAWLMSFVVYQIGSLIL